MAENENDRLEKERLKKMRETEKSTFSEVKDWIYTTYDQAAQAGHLGTRPQAEAEKRRRAAGK